MTAIADVSMLEDAASLSHEKVVIYCPTLSKEAFLPW